MNIALTLVIQGFVFFLVAWAVMKFFWPWLMEAIEDAAEENRRRPGRRRARARRIWTRPRQRSKEIIREARDRAAQIVDQAGKRSNEMVEEAKGTASSEAQRLVAQAHDEVARESTRAREGLRQEVGKLAVEGASRLLGREIDPQDPRRAAGQIGRRGRAWLSGPPSPGPTRKRRSNTPRDANAFAAVVAGPQRCRRDRRRSARRGAHQESAADRRPTSPSLITDVAGAKLDAGHAELRARAGGESPPAAAAGNRGALRSAARGRSRIPSMSR